METTRGKTDYTAQIAEFYEELYPGEGLSESRPKALNLLIVNEMIPNWGPEEFSRFLNDDPLKTAVNAMELCLSLIKGTILAEDAAMFIHTAIATLLKDRCDRVVN